MNLQDEDQQEVILNIIRDNLTINVEGGSVYSGDMNGSGSLYQDTLTVQLLLEGVVISYCSI